MVWLAKWIREHQPDARVLLITDRTELDEQIEGVFNGVNEEIYRTNSGADLLGTLNQSRAQWLICSLDPQVPRLRRARRDRDEADAEFIQRAEGQAARRTSRPRATSSSSSTRPTAPSPARCTTP